MAKFTISDLDLKAYLCSVLEMGSEVAAKLSDIRREEERAGDRGEMSMAQFLSLIHEYLLVGLGDVGCKHVQ